MAVKIRCSFCKGAYSWETKNKWPRFCPLCSADMSNDRDDHDIVMPFIRTNAKTKAVDDVYRQMEAGSITRAQIAAEMVGAPVSEMSGLKITNMRDNQRQGDTAIALENSPVSELMAAAPQAFGFQGGAGQSYGGDVSSGILPNRGSQMRKVLQETHQSHGNVISDPVNDRRRN